MGRAMRLGLLKRGLRNRQTAFGQFRHDVDYLGYRPLSFPHAYADAFDENASTLVVPCTQFVQAEMF